MATSTNQPAYAGRSPGQRAIVAFSVSQLLLLLVFAERAIHYLLFTVTPGQSSVRNGVSGSPAWLYILTTGLSAQP